MATKSTTVPRLALLYGSLWTRKLAACMDGIGEAGSCLTLDVTAAQLGEARVGLCLSTAGY